MDRRKLSGQIQLALRYQNILSMEATELFIINRDENIWEMIIEYVNDISVIQEELAVTLFYLSNSFAIIHIRKEDISRFTEYPNIIYMSFPYQMHYINVALNQICATNVASEKGRYRLTGSGTLIAIIDTGIDYAHPDFISTQLESRILYLWDQTIVGNPPAGFFVGTEYTNQDINNALQESTREAQLGVVPSQDTIGHGTAMAGIAASNGGGSREYVGVAPECELIIVKMGSEKNPEALPTDKDVMLGVKYVVEKAIEQNKPVSILLGVGYNTDFHDGNSTLERYIEQMCSSWKCNCVVGVGNQGNKGSHASGKINNNETKVVELFIDNQISVYECSIWKSFIDKIELFIESPTGEKTEVLSILTPNRAFVFDNTVVLINFSTTKFRSKKQEILIWFQSAQGMEVDEGVWRISFIGGEVLDGSYDIWGSIIGEAVNQTQFLAPDPNTTLTIPSANPVITSVAAFDGRSSQVATFSGRGYNSLNQVKPDITAPGVMVMTTSIKEGMLYEAVSGTSAAAAFVAGTYAILLQYSMNLLGEDYVYGESLTLFMLRNTQKLPALSPYPNNQWGYGILCVEQILNSMTESLLGLS